MRKKLTDEKFFAGLSETEWDAAVAIEAEVNAVIPDGLTNKGSLRTVRAIMELRRSSPGVRVENLLMIAIEVGVPAVAELFARAQPLVTRAELTGVKVRGI